MLLAIEIGNTTVAAGLFRGRQQVARWSAPTHADVLPAAHLSAWLTGLERPAEAIVAGVAPAAVAAWATACGERTDSVTAWPNALAVPLPARYEPPGSLGVDRLLAALAAVDGWGAPVLVADCGTATTIDAVDAAGVFAGGAIACGLATQRAALTERTALLPEVELTPPPAALGRSTEACLQSGLVLGHAALIRGLADRLRAELAAPAAPLIGAGGLAKVVAAADPTLFTAVEPDLCLRGLVLAHARRAGEVRA